MKFVRVALMALLTSAVGCSDDEPDLLPAPLPECPNHDYTSCDTRSVGCQERMLSLATCIYGAAEQPVVPVHVISEAEFRDALEAGQAEAEESQTEEDVAATELLESALTDLRLVEEGALSSEASIDNIVESFAGVYQDAETGIILIDRGAPQNTPEADATLVHEYIHALQDIDHDLDTWSEPYRGATDRILSIRSVIEGEATFYGLRAGFAMLGYPDSNTDWEGVFRNLRVELNDRAREHPSPYVASAATFPYAYGGLLAYRAWFKEGPGFAAPLVSDPPLSTAGVLQQLFPEDFAADRTEQDPAEPTTTGDYALLDHDVLGSWLLRMLLIKFGLDDADAEPLSKTWTGDHLWLYRDPDDRRAWLWQLELDDDDTAEAIARLLDGELPEGCVIERAGQRLFVANGGEGPPQELLDAGRAFIEPAEPAP
jgi:hypothetical protein